MAVDKQEVLPESENKFTIIFLYLSFILIGIINTFLGPILPFLTEKWQLNDVQAGYFLAAQGLGGLFGTLTTSFLYSRIRSKLILAIGFFFIIVAQFGLNSDVWAIGLFSSLLSGLALGAIIPTATLIVSQLAGENRAPAINLLNFFWALGAVSSPMIFFGLSSQHQLNYLFIIIALVGIIFLTLLLKLKSIRIASSKEKSTVSNQEKVAVLFSVWLFVVTVFLQIGIEASFSGWLPTFAKRITVSDWWLLAPTLYWLGFLSSRLLSGFYLRRIGEKPSIIFGLLIVIAGQAVLLLTNQIEISSFGAFLVGFGTAPVFPTTIAILSGRFEQKAPELLSYMFLLSGLSSMTFSWLIGYTASITGGLKSALLIPMICALTLFILHLTLRNKSA